MPVKRWTRQRSSPRSSFSSSRLYYRNETVHSGGTRGTADDHERQRRTNTTLPTEKEDTLSDSRANFVNNDKVKLLRENLKQELARVAIEEYDMEAYVKRQQHISNATKGVRQKTTIAEDVMRDLEGVNPWPLPAYDARLNARWSFVFTGVPTIGMKLITLLSRLSVGFPPIDFQTVFLEVSNRNSMVKAIVSCQLLGFLNVELNVYTSLRPPTTQELETARAKTNPVDPDHVIGNGTLLIEQFQSLSLQGVQIPTPSQWHGERTLEITYMDDDMMIARTNGGEPHLLLRHSPCSTDTAMQRGQENEELLEDEECDIDNDLTNYFADAQTRYGKEGLARSLVDRAYALERDYQKQRQFGQNDTKRVQTKVQGASVFDLIRSILMDTTQGH